MDGSGNGLRSTLNWMCVTLFPFIHIHRRHCYIADLINLSDRCLKYLPAEILEHRVIVAKRVQQVTPLRDGQKTGFPNAHETKAVLVQSVRVLPLKLLLHLRADPGIEIRISSIRFVFDAKE